LPNKSGITGSSLRRFISESLSPQHKIFPIKNLTFSDGRYLRTVHILPKQ